MWVASVVSLSSCVKDDLYNTPHPDKGAVEVTTDWTGRSSDAVVPADYILRIGGEEQTVQGETNAFKSLFLPRTQSLFIARAAAASPRLLLLDEITANLDAETEKEVLQALKRVSGDRTVISISHRTSAEMGRIIPIG